MKLDAAYEELIRRTREEVLLASCAELLGWDELTYMPRGGVEYRGEQMAYLAGLLHEKGTDPRIGDLLHVLEDSTLTSDPQSTMAVNVRETRRSYDRLVKLPRSLVEELARVTSLAQQEWLVALQNNDFPYLLSSLEQIFALKRSEAEALGYVSCPYDALLEDYEPGVTTQEISALFTSLRRELVPLAEAIAGSRVKSKAAILRREFPIERQRVFGETLAAAVGFDFQRGRIDTTVHPFFSSIGPGDCRITTRYQTHNFSDSLFATLHEVGHGLYEQGLNAEHHGTPMGQAASLGLHESQARFWENFVGRNRAFWKHFYPRLRQVFHEALQDVDLDGFYKAINTVSAGPHRVPADEITYNLHIMVRFDLERAMLHGDLQPADLPTAWNEAYKKYLGITPINDAEGCLQDGHWASGLIGYFPTYTLGDVYGAQMSAKATADLGDLNGAFAGGDFGDMLSWLRQHVYLEGSRWTGPGLISHLTGSPPIPGPLMERLRLKYGVLYRL